MAFYGADENHECRRRRRRRRLKKKKKKDADVFDGYQGYADYSYSLHSFLQTLLHKHENGENIPDLPLIIMVGDHGPGHWDDGEPRHDNALLQMLVPTDVLQSNPHILANLKVCRCFCTGVSLELEPGTKVPPPRLPSSSSSFPPPYCELLLPRAKLTHISIRAGAIDPVYRVTDNNALSQANKDRRLGPYDVYEVLHWIATGGVRHVLYAT